jgi:hypothetical protein
MRPCYVIFALFCHSTLLLFPRRTINTMVSLLRSKLVFRWSHFICHARMLLDIAFLTMTPTFARYQFQLFPSATYSSDCISWISAHKSCFISFFSLCVHGTGLVRLSTDCRRVSVFLLGQFLYIYMDGFASSSSVTFLQYMVSMGFNGASLDLKWDTCKWV